MIEGAETILRDELEQLRLRIIANMERVGAIASGRTRDSMHVEASAEGGILYGGLPQGAPFGTLETGRRGGAVPYGFAAIILKWMEAKGIKATPIGKQTQQSADKSLAWAISRRIAKSGTSLFRRGGRADVYSNEIPTTIDNISRRMLDVLRLQVESIKINTQPS